MTIYNKKCQEAKILVKYLLQYRALSQSASLWYNYGTKRVWYCSLNKNWHQKWHWNSFLPTACSMTHNETHVGKITDSGIHHSITRIIRINHRIIKTETHSSQWRSLGIRSNKLIKPNTMNCSSSSYPALSTFLLYLLNMLPTKRLAVKLYLSKTRM